MQPRLNGIAAITVGILFFTACSTGAQSEPNPTYTPRETPAFTGSSGAKDLIEELNEKTIVECELDSVDPRVLNDDSSIRWDTITCNDDSIAYYALSTESKDHVLKELEDMDYPEIQTAYTDHWVFTGSPKQTNSVVEELNAEYPDFPEFSISCRDDERVDTGDFSDLSEVWDELDKEERTSCSGSWTHSDQVEAAEFHQYTDTELEALEVADYEKDLSLPTLYSICAESYLGDYKQNIPWSSGQAQEVEGALVLCPDHPEREEVEQRIAEGAEAEAQEERGERFHAGTFKVGEDVQPGTYVVEREDGFEGCYWERLDASGNIIANNFIRSGFRAEVTIAESDYSFSSSKCGEWIKQ